MTSALLVPFHLDERLEDLVPPFDHDTLDQAGPVDLVALHRAAGERVAAGVEIVVSGDCVAPLGVLAGLQRRGLDPGLVWLDAHGDANTEATTPSGYLGGMTLAKAVGWGDRELAHGIGLAPLAEQRVLLVGARDLDVAEREALDRSGITRRHLADLDGGLPEGALHVHLDLDIVDPGELPGLRYPAPGGPHRAEVHDAVARLAATGRVVALSLACTWAPGVQPAGAYDIAMPLLQRLLDA
jgi:arginase